MYSGTLFDQIQQVKDRNARLRARVAELTESRDAWKRKAVTRKRQIEELKRNPRQRKRKVPPRYYSVEQWRQHALIVERIRAIPNREL